MGVGVAGMDIAVVASGWGRGNQVNFGDGFKCWEQGRGLALRCGGVGPGVLLVTVGTEAIAAFLPVAEVVEFGACGHGHDVDEFGTEDFAGAAGGVIYDPSAGDRFSLLEGTHF